MPLRRPLQLAMESLTEYQNRDGGIPATLPSQHSGAWTSGSCLEAFLLCGYTPLKMYQFCRQLTEFVLNTQLPDGGWPLVDASTSSTFSTGHNVSSLMVARDVFSDDNSLEQRLNHGVESGLEWLYSKQNEDGGWGVAPDSGTDGKLSRIASTYYALRPLFRSNMYFNSSPTIRRAINYIKPYQRRDGGWPFVRGAASDNVSEVSNTARCVLMILHSGHLTSDSAVVSKACNFIASKTFPKSSWELGIEGFYADSSQAQNIYHNNSPCDALLALTAADHNYEVVIDGLRWLIATQREDGIWPLQSANPNQRGHAQVWTWSTSEFIYAVDYCAKKTLPKLIESLPLSDPQSLLSRIIEEITK